MVLGKPQEWREDGGEKQKNKQIIIFSNKIKSDFLRGI